MPLPLSPPIDPMLARLSRELPEGEYAYEPKWDGFRCLAFASGADVDLRSRHGRALGRFFPELREAIVAAVPGGAVLDAEMVVVGPAGFDFAALLARTHPSPSRVARLARETPATFVVFDLLAEGDDDLCARPFRERRARLESLLAAAPPAVRPTPLTRDAALARAWLARHQGRGIDGVVAKPLGGRYEPGRRAMVKVKRERTVECVVGGFRTYAGEPVVASLLLGLYDGDALVHVGVSSSFPERQRRDLYSELSPLVVPLPGHPWEKGFNLGRSPVGRLRGSAGRWDPAAMPQDWTVVRPERVLEVACDQIDAGRLRHPARFVRWRPDREASSCTFDQLALAPPAEPPR